MRKLLSIIAFLTLSLTGWAQDRISVDAPNMVGVDEQFNVTFSIEGEHQPSDFQWNPGSDFQLVWGPQKGSSTSISIINGKTTKSSQNTYTYILLPKRKGSFRLSPATATVKGKQISSSAPVIQVLESGSSTGAGASSGNSGSASGSQGNSSSSDVAATGDVSGGDLFLRLSLSRTSAVIGEPITAVLKLYQRVNIAGFEDAKFPSFNGFWSQAVDSPSNISFVRENVGDKIYNAAVLRSYVLIPQQAGTITIDPAELVCLVNVRANTRTGNSVFDSFFGDDYTTIRKRVTTPSMRIKVSALPGGAPASFGGGVGNYTMTVKVSKDSLKTHDAASLIVTVSGNGNVALLEAPKINFPPDFDVYDVKSTENTTKGGASGSKTFEFPFIPRSSGDFTLDPVEYTYYDINSGRYVTLKSQPLNLKVAKGSESDATAAQNALTSSVDRNGVKNLANDIRFIVTQKPAFTSTGSFFVGTALFWLIIAVLALLSLGYWFIFRNLAARRADVAGTKNRTAVKMARKRLKVAGDYLKQNLYSAFYEELHKALLGFISDKLNLSSADLNKDNIAEALKDQGVSDELVSSFNGLLDACEFARYAPDAGHDAMNAHYESAVSVISSIDSSMKGKKVIKTENGNVSGEALLIALMLMLPVFGTSINAKAAENNYLDSLWAKGVNAYSAGQWQTAINDWSSISKTGIESAVLYYNEGNAYFKNEEYGKAILNYERALKLDPSYSDARFNLEFANNFIQDKIDPVPEFILKGWARKVSYILDSNAWAVLAIVFFASMLVMILLFVLSSRVGARRTGFFTAIVLLVFTIAAFGFSKWQQNSYLKADSAIVMRAVTSVKSSPSTESAKDLFILHEGTKVKLLDEVGGWKNIELADGRQGWINAGDLEVI